VSRHVSRHVFTAAACCVLPVTAVIVCTAWSMGAGLIEPCLPLIDGCTSISRACRQVPVIYLFRTVMLPCSLLLILFWWQENQRLAARAPTRAGLRRVVLVLAIGGGAFLVPYVVFLGTDGPVYDFLRRLGIYFFFGGTGIAQLLATLVLERNAGTDRAPVELRVRRVLVIAMLALGPLNLLLKATLADPDRMENVIEWWFALALFAWFGMVALARHADGPPGDRGRGGRRGQGAGSGDADELTDTGPARVQSRGTSHST